MVVVETLKPKQGQLRFSYTGNFTVGWADLSDFNLMNAAEKLEYEKLAGAYRMQTVSIWMRTEKLSMSLNEHVITPV